MRKLYASLGFAGTVLCVGCLVAAEGPGRKLSPVQRFFGAQEVDVSPFQLRPSELLDHSSVDELKRWGESLDDGLKHCPFNSYVGGSTPSGIKAARQCVDKFYMPPLLSKLKQRYSVKIEQSMIGGVPTELFMPGPGVLESNKKRILINLHGGSFQTMGRWGGEVESIPIAAVGRIRVVSVDYRMAPEFRFPAATEDVGAVYRALLLKYKPENIGIYGCSAGGILTAEATAYFQKKKLPRPGAIGMFSAAALPPDGSDSGQIMEAVQSEKSSGSFASRRPLGLLYFEGADPKSPLVFPGLDPSILERFPPSLLMSATRDALMSSVIATHAELNRLGVKADLHIWEGQVHCFFFDPDMQESQEAYKVIARFFDQNLGKHEGGPS